MHTKVRIWFGLSIRAGAYCGVTLALWLVNFSIMRHKFGIADENFFGRDFITATIILMSMTFVLVMLIGMTKATAATSTSIDKDTPKKEGWILPGLHTGAFFLLFEIIVIRDRSIFDFGSYFATGYIFICCLTLWVVWYYYFSIEKIEKLIANKEGHRAQILSFEPKN